MKVNLILLCILVLTFLACGTSHHVVDADGKVYRVKGNDIHHKGEEITDDLSQAEKREINALLDEKIKTERSTKEQLEKLKEEQEELEKIEKEAEKKRESLKEEQKKLEREKKLREKAKDDFLDAQKKLQDQTKKYERLKRQGKLNEKDVKRWKQKIFDLEDDVKEAKKEFDKLSHDK